MHLETPTKHPDAAELEKALLTIASYGYFSVQFSTHEGLVEVLDEIVNLARDTLGIPK